MLSSMRILGQELSPEAPMRPVAGVLALLVAAAGWYYLFYSRAASNLSGLEDPELNAKRVRLRRMNGVVMILLAAMFFIGFWTVRWDKPTAEFAIVWLTVFALLGIVVVLVLIDVRLTARLRKRRQQMRNEWKEE